MANRHDSLLIATLGSKAQIITLALDLLQQQGNLPGEVVIIHTWRDRFETAQALSRLQADLPLTYPHLICRSLELCDESGQPTWRSFMTRQVSSVVVGQAHFC